MSAILHALPPWNVWLAIGLAAAFWVATLCNRGDPIPPEDVDRIPGDW